MLGICIKFMQELLNSLKCFEDIPSWMLFQFNTRVLLLKLLHSTVSCGNTQN